MRFKIQFLLVLLFAYQINNVGAAESWRSGVLLSHEVIQNAEPLLDMELVTKEPISYELFALSIFEDIDPYHVGLVQKGFKSVPEFIPTESCANIMRFLINHSHNRSYLLTLVPEIIGVLRTVQQQDYLSYAMHVLTIFNGPYHLSRQGAIRDYCQYVNSPVYQSPSLIQKKQARFIATAFGQRPQGSLSSAHLLKVMRIFARLKNVDEYERFSSFAQGLPHYDSYHYLLTLETMGKMPINMLNETLKAEIFQFAQTHHPQNIPYELMRRLPEV